MRYIRNITNSNVRVAGKIEKTPGGHIHDSVNLQPEHVVTKIDPKTRDKSYVEGQNVAEVPDEFFSNREFTRSLNYLFAEISREEFEERQDIIDASLRGREAAPQEIPGFLSRDHVMTVDQKGATVEEPVTRIEMDPETLEIYAGAASGTTTVPDKGRGQTLTEMNREGVRRADAPAVPVDPAIVAKMGQGQ